MSDMVAPPPDQLSDEELVRQLNAASSMSDEDLVRTLNAGAAPSEPLAPWPPQPRTDFFGGQTSELTQPEPAGREFPMNPNSPAGRTVLAGGEAAAAAMQGAWGRMDRVPEAPSGSLSGFAGRLFDIGAMAFSPVSVPFSAAHASLKQARDELAQPYSQDPSLSQRVLGDLLGGPDAVMDVAAAIPANIEENIGYASERVTGDTNPEIGRLGGLAGSTFLGLRGPRAVRSGTRGALRMAEPTIIRHAPAGLAEALVPTPPLRGAPARPPRLPGPDSGLLRTPEFAPLAERIAFDRSLTRAREGLGSLRPDPNAPQAPTTPPPPPPPPPGPQDVARRAAETQARRAEVLPSTESPGTAPIRERRALGETRPTLDETLSERALLRPEAERWNPPSPDFPSPKQRQTFAEPLQEQQVRRALGQERGFDRAPDELAPFDRKYDAFDLERQSPGAGEALARRQGYETTGEWVIPEEIPGGRDVRGARWWLGERARSRIDPRRRFPEELPQAPNRRIEGDQPARLDFPARRRGTPPDQPPPPAEQPGGAPLPPSILDQVVFEADKPPPAKGRVQRGLEATADYFERQAPLGRFERDVTGKVSDTGPRAAAEAFQGAAPYQIENLYRRGTYEGRQVFPEGAAPEALLRKVEKAGDQRALTEYGIARRLKERYEELPKGVTDAEIARVIADVEANNPQVKAAAEAVSKSYQTIWGDMHEAGLIPDEVYNATKGKFYVPMDRYFGPDAVGALSRGNMLSRPGVKKVKGGAQPFEDWVPKTFDRLVNMKTIVDRGRVGRKIVEVYDKNPEAATNYIREVPAGQASKFDYGTLFRESVDELKAQGLTDAQARMGAREMALDKWIDSYSGETVTTHFPGGGKRVFQVVDEPMARAIGAGGSKFAGFVNGLLETPPGKVGEAFTQSKRAGITLPLEFITRQAMLYDPVNYLVQDPGPVTTKVQRAVKGHVDAGRAMINELARIWGKDKDVVSERVVGRLYDELGPMHFASLDRPARSSFTASSPTTMAGKSGKFLADTGRRTIDSIRALAEAQQSAYRRAAVEGTLERFLKSGEWKPGQPLTLDQQIKLTNDALRVSGSFRLGSEASSAMNRLAAFWKAGERIPADALYWSKKNPKQMVATTLLVGVAPHVLEWWKYRDEDWYQDMPDYRRAGLTLNENITLPIAHPVMLAGVSVKETLRAMYDEGGDARQAAINVGRAFAEQLGSWSGAGAEAAVEFADTRDIGDAALAAGSNLTPDAVRGIAEVATNRDLFTGREVNPPYLEGRRDVAPEQVTDESIAPWVNDLSRRLNESLGVPITPLEIRQLAGAYGGTLGKRATRVGVEDPEPRDQGVFGWMNRRIRESQEVRDYYDLRRRYMARSDAMRGYKKAEDVPGFERVQVGKPTPTLRTIEKAMRDLNEEYRTASVERKREIVQEMREGARAGSEILRYLMGETE